MDNRYWLERWEKGQIGFHQAEIEPALIKQFSTLKPTKVFVPFCGKSKDLIWLASQGHHVLGVEISELACRAFFDENKLAYQAVRKRKFTIFSAQNIEIYCGDFFDLNSEDMNGLGAVYDRAALIALPSDIRARYAEHMRKLLVGKRPLLFLQICLERTPDDNWGPPFSVSEKELNRLYGESFEIDLINRESVEQGGPDLTQADECIYFLVAE